jgi:hypothetical protein
MPTAVAVRIGGATMAGPRRRGPGPDRLHGAAEFSRDIELAVLATEHSMSEGSGRVARGRRVSLAIARYTRLKMEVYLMDEDFLTTVRKYANIS